MKHTKNKYFRILLIAGLVFSLQSCLKNNKYHTDFSKGAPAVELPLAAKFANKPFAVSFSVATAPTTYYAVVNVASVDKPSTTITATIGIDSTYLNQYNATQDAAAKAAQAAYLAVDPNNTVNDSGYPADYSPYELLPDSAYQIPSLSASITAGRREDSLQILFFTSKIAQGHAYILPITIVSSSLPISNWNHLLINVGAKNAFDGAYNVTGTFVDLTHSAFSGAYPKTVSLVTQGLLSAAYFDGILGGYGYVFNTGGGLSYFGNFDPVFVFDADGNVISMYNYYSDPAPRSRDAKLDTSPGSVNKYDFNTKSFDVSYFLMQSGAIRGKIHEVWTYTGPR
jgi:hypothetical protein